MTLRTKSRSQQWTVWFCAVLVSAGVYVVLSRILNGSSGWDVFAPRQHRLIVPLLVLLVYIVKETRWDGVVRGGKSKSEEGRSAEGEGLGRRSRSTVVSSSDSAGQPVDAAYPPTEGSCAAGAMRGDCRVEKEETTSDLTRQAAASTEESDLCQPQPSTSTFSLSGEELYAQARGMRHQPIPDFNTDDEYLKLLGASAAKGYPRAMSKLGEYAMRRSAWVEAYYWMSQARRNGMHGLSPTLREIRACWARDDFPVQASNVNELFTAEAGSIGRALLHVDSGHEVARAKEFLKANHPEFLP